MRSPLHLLALVAILLATGCYRSSSVTPWLRTSSYHEVELIAESGGGSHGWAKTERLRNGAWVQISSRDRALSLAGGKLAVYIDTTAGRERMVLTNEAGDIVPLECSDQLRVAPDGKSLVCVETSAHWLQPEDANTIRVSRIDLRGMTASAVTLTLPPKSLPRSFFPHFPGFLSDGTPVLTVHVNADVERFERGEKKMCAAYALRSGAPEALLAVDTASWPDCDEASFWGELGLVSGDVLAF